MTRRWKTDPFIATAVAFVLAMLAVLAPTTASAVNARVRIGIEKGMMSALCILAREKGFYARNGLDVTLVEYPSGKLALAALFDGKVDLATVAETPLSLASFQRQDFAIVTTLATADNEPAIVARRDSGIVMPADLRNRRIATQQGSAVHFFLHLYLLKLGLTERDIKPSFTQPEAMVDALRAGSIDAFAMREPFVSRAERALGRNAVVFRAPGLYQKFINLVTMRDSLRAQSDAIKRLLGALCEAERHAFKHPGEVARIMAAHLGEEEKAAAGLLNDIVLHVGLDQSLLLFLEDEARWAIKSGLVKQTAMPNMLQIISTDSLMAVKPSSVILVK